MFKKNLNFVLPAYLYNTQQKYKHASVLFKNKLHGNLCKTDWKKWNNFVKQIKNA